MISARWYNWSKFKGIAITTAAGTSNKELDYKDSYSVSLGGEYDVSPALTLRAGTMFDRSPTNPQHLTTRVPDGDRTRSEERRVGKEWVRTCRSRWSPEH